MRKFLFLLPLLAALSGPIANAQQISAAVAVSPANQTGIAATGSLGLAAIVNQGGCILRPQTTGNVFAFLSGNAVNGTAGDGATFQLAYGLQSAAPANGAAVPASWTVVGAGIGSGNGGTTSETFTVAWWITGLTPGLLYGFDLKVTIVTGGTETVTNINCVIKEQ